MRILLIEDDYDISDAMSFSLSKEGYAVDIRYEGDDGLRAMREQGYDLVILDRMLPSLNGLDILRIARREGIFTPVLMVTAMGTSDNLIEGLDYGADDYIVKPFIMDELLARIRAILRRPQSLEVTDEIIWETLILDVSKMSLRNGSKAETLTKRECALLTVFMRNINTVLSRTTLLNHVWGIDTTVEEGILDNYMTFIRRKLIAVDSPLIIKTIHGVGYLMEDAKE